MPPILGATAGTPKSFFLIESWTLVAEPPHLPASLTSILSEEINVLPVEKIKLDSVMESTLKLPQLTEST